MQSTLRSRPGHVKRLRRAQRRLLPPRDAPCSTCVPSQMTAKGTPTMARLNAMSVLYTGFTEAMLKRWRNEGCPRLSFSPRPRPRGLGLNQGHATTEWECIARHACKYFFVPQEICSKSCNSSQHNHPSNKLWVTPLAALDRPSCPLCAP